MSDKLKELEDINEQLKNQVRQLRNERERAFESMLAWRGIDIEYQAYCTKCGGSGVFLYANTSTWRKGAGGQAMTNDVCDACWGSGNFHKPWPSHRKLKDKKTK